MLVYAEEQLEELLELSMWVIKCCKINVVQEVWQSW